MMNMKPLYARAGATAIAAFVWLGIYWLMGLRLPTTIPFLYQVLTALIVGIYLKTRNFDFYRMAQLALFLFVIQWSIGSFVNSSGIVLLALLAPVGAMVVYGPRESIPWFATYVVLTILSGLFDYYLADGSLSGVPMRTVAVFFVLNFTILSSIVYLLLRYFVNGLLGAIPFYQLVDVCLIFRDDRVRVLRAIARDVQHRLVEIVDRAFIVAPDTPLCEYVVSFGANVEASGGVCASKAART